MSLNAAIVNHHVDQALSSPLFRKAERQSRLLRFVVDAALQSPEATIKEFDIGIAGYDRRSDYDPRTDPIVRVEAAGLRARLREYYEDTPPEVVRIDIPKGRYVPVFISVGDGPAQMASDLSILVPPFRSLSPDPGDQNFCDGLTEEVVYKLAQDHRLQVITLSAAAWLERGDGPKPRYLLEASVWRAGAEIRLTLHLIELTGAGVTHFSIIYQATINDIFATRPMFTREIGLQAKKFSDMLAWVIAHLEDPDELSSEMRALGARHSGYGVKIDQYAPLGSALTWMFQHTLGDRFTPEMEEAWLEAYAFLTLEVERGSREAAGWYLSVALI